MEVAGRLDRETQKSSTSSKLLCTPCQSEEREKKAEGYCEVCTEFLCPQCEQYHRKFRLTKHHPIRKGFDIPANDTQTTGPDVTCTDICKVHPGKLIEYICRDHDVFGCSVCTTVGHRSCKIDYIPDVAKCFKGSEEYKTLVNTIYEIGAMVKDIAEKLKERRQNIETKQQTAVEDIQKFRMEINTYLNEQERRLLEKTVNLNTNNEEEVAKLDNVQRNLHQNWKHLKYDLEQDNDKMSQLYIKARKITADVMRLKRECESFFDNAEMGEYKFIPSESLQDIIQNKATIGEIIETTNNPWNLKDLKLRGSLKLNHKEDVSGPLITGMAVVSPDMLFVADRNNESIKLIDTRTHGIMSSLKLSARPCDVVTVPDDKVAVTLPFPEKIQIVDRQGKSLSEAQLISVQGRCCGISFNDDKLVVAFNEPAKVEIIGLNGSVYTSFSISSQPYYWWSGPYTTVSYICTTPYIYVGNNNENSIEKFTMDGKTVSQLKDKRLSGPRGLQFLGNSCIAVCSYEEMKITKITDRNGEMKIERQLECTVKPVAMAFSLHKHELFVSASDVNNKNVVSIYSMLQ